MTIGYWSRQADIDPGEVGDALEDAGLTSDTAVEEVWLTGTVESDFEGDVYEVLIELEGQ